MPVWGRKPRPDYCQKVRHSHKRNGNLGPCGEYRNPYAGAHQGDYSGAVEQLGTEPRVQSTDGVCRFWWGQLHKAIQ